MPIKDPAKRREYQKEYRRRKRNEKAAAAIEAVSGDVQNPVKPSPVKPSAGPPRTVADVLDVIGRQIYRLETDNSLDPILVARAISPLASVFIKGVETAEIETRLAEIERKIEHANRRTA